MKTVGTIFGLFLLSLLASAQIVLSTIDPTTGLPIDPKTGLPALDPATGLPIETSQSLTKPPQGLDKTATDADLVFKGQVVSGTRITNAAFQISDMFVHATTFKIISILKGTVSSDFVVFQHYNEWSPGGHGWGGSKPPEPFKFENEQSYVIFAANMAKPGYYYSRPPETTNQQNEFRQLTENRNSIFHTLDARPLTGLSISNALWLEHNAECAAQVLPYATNLVWVINNSPFTLHRAAAIAALSATGFSIVSNSLPLWLNDPAEMVRAQAVLLLPDFHGEFSERTLQILATDSSPLIRSMVANAIGNGKLQRLLPTLMALFSESQDSTNTEPLLTRQGRWPGTELWSEDANSVHASAGYALLKFDVSQVSDFLKTNLNDAGFRVRFLSKLAENNPSSWLTNLVSELKSRRERIWKKAEGGNGSNTKYFYTETYLTGAYYDCWNIIYRHLTDLPDSAFANGKLDWCLDVLEYAGTADSNRTIEIYELYRSKGLERPCSETSTQKWKG